MTKLLTTSLRKSAPLPTAEGFDARAGQEPFAYACPANCGCIWRDNGDGTMSLFGKHSASCEVCEPLPLAELIPLYRATAASGAQRQIDNILALCNEHLSGRHYADAEDAVRNLLQAYVTMKGNEEESSWFFLWRSRGDEQEGSSLGGSEDVLSREGQVVKFPMWFQRIGSWFMRILGIK